MTHVRLCMLARDEADRMAEVAEACGHLYDDAVVLIDDRTTDDTAGAARAALDYCRIDYHTFEDFSQARNRLFDLAREDAPPGAWLLLVDPDTPPRGGLPDPLERPGVTAWDCTWFASDGSVEWRLPILVRADCDCRYTGGAHELLEGHTAAWTPSLRVEVAAKPPNPERSRMYVEILRRDAATNPRSAFYLARSLAELGESGAAIEQYLKRAQMGDTGWVEETFFCLLEVGRLMLPLDIDLAYVILSRAHRFRPSRIEPLYWLAWLANWQGEHDAALALCVQAVSTPTSTDALFVNRWAERAGIVEEMQKAIDGGATPPPILDPEEVRNG